MKYGPVKWMIAECTINHHIIEVFGLYQRIHISCIRNDTVFDISAKRPVAPPHGANN